MDDDGKKSGRSLLEWVALFPGDTSAHAPDNSQWLKKVAAEPPHGAARRHDATENRQLYSRGLLFCPALFPQFRSTTTSNRLSDLISFGEDPEMVFQFAR